MKRKIKISVAVVVVMAIIYWMIPTHKSSYDVTSAIQTLVGQRTSNAYFTQDEFEWFLITPDHVPLYVFETGHGDNIVALHGGFGMDHSYMRTMLKPYEKDHHIVYYDQRGSLRSPVPEGDLDKYISIENMVNDLELLRANLGEEQLTLIAHSMGAVLAYEYMRRFPQNVADVIIISGFIPKFPSSKAEFHDMFVSQQEREEFKHREAVVKVENELGKTMDAKSRAYAYLKWKTQYAACQIYNFENWEKMEGGLGLFNPRMNELIGPESNMPLTYMAKFYWNNRLFEKGELIGDDTETSDSPINYLPEIENHSKPITYLLGRYEVGDWNLRLYERYLSGVSNADLHIFEKSCHNIWMDQPDEFYNVLGDVLSKLGNKAMANRDSSQKILSH